MKSKTLFASLLAGAALLLGLPAFANDHAGKDKAAPAAGQLVPVTEKDAAWAAEARKSYPLKTCVTSDEELGSMGDSPEYIYRVKGQPDRLVIFCCKGCDEDFLKEPAKYLAKLDAAAKGKDQKSKPEDKADKHQGHHD